MTVLMKILDQDKLLKMLEVAGRDTTPDNEAMNAVRFCRSALDRAGMTFADLMSGRPPHAKLVEANSSAHNQVVTTLKQRVFTLEGQLTELRNENESLKAEKRAAPAQASLSSIPVPVNGFYEFQQFRRAVVEMLGFDHGWQIAFSQQTEYDDHTIQNWRQRGKVPEAVFEVIPTLRPVNKERKVEWTSAEKDRLKELKAENDSLKSQGVEVRTLKEISDILSREFGRRITHNSIKGQWDRIK